ncbi:hypothetical protein COCSADRAFT_84949 [Bipolaris sorokiniana ND90Pr]|uniref:Lytic polysaccharide monooxygenase n=1 Tax=Cochliobolus sativus (strain ND90Pr / ATCC 201652) TaxID=665912 RepID=M2SVU4_COCSN|nr:uncharacterized protein COCSADRAFT_84949 [Bipolaris sorokiniana ND90Pr]EMD66420.1 hypothetical protein COCSADRAFT_84949 [Bipolaris sorokiniana ND90Pr]
MYVVRILLASLATTARAHMSLWYPPPLGGSKEANSFTTQVDKEFNFPIGCCDSQGEPTLPSPGDCRGHLDLLDTEEGRPQVTWKPGQDAYFELSDHMYSIGVPGSTHYGGSCQVGFSVDKGQTWKVAASYHGNCPHRDKNMPQVFEFKVPLNIPTGIAVFGWIWLNREHEFFMNCAAVQISSSSSSTTTRTYKSFKTLHRRLENSASDVCDWNTAPSMETSYYSVDARCAPSAKLKNLKSDEFEIGWGDVCGVVEGDKEYTIQNIKC